MYRRKRVVCIGGGTGLSTLLRGLKTFTEDLTAIVTVADNGGHSGILRKEMNMPPPGDIRNCLVALAQTEPIMKDILQYRFKEGQLEGHNMGNLFIAALTDIYGSFEKAILKMNDFLAVNGQVLPVSMDDVQLEATYIDGSKVLGEHEIVYTNKTACKRIIDVALVPSEVKANVTALEAIEFADLIVLGPGSLYTSVIPNLLVDGIVEAIRRAKGKKVFISNIMTQPGETDGFKLSDHVNAIEKYLGKGILEYVITSSTALEDEILSRYDEESAYMVVNDITTSDYKILEMDMAVLSKHHAYVRHNPERLGEMIISL